MSDTRTSPSPPEAWLKEAFSRMRVDMLLFGRTFAAFMLRPGRSAREWQTGRSGFMNPLAFAAAGAAIYWGVTRALMALWPVPALDNADRLVEQIASALGPYLHYGLLGFTMHLGLRALGSPRPVLASIGAALFGGGSIGTLTALLLTATTRWFGHLRGTSALELRTGDHVPTLIFLAALTSYALICFVIARALMALHSTAPWKIVVASAAAVLVTAILFGSVLPYGEYGWHPFLRLDPRNGFAVAGFGFRA